jgi:hypothetical protein
MVDWSRPFDKPIQPPKGKKLRLRLAKVRSHHESEQDIPWKERRYLLILVSKVILEA